MVKKRKEWENKDLPMLAEKLYKYFAYGSNLNIAQMKRRCPQSRPLMKGTLVGGELTFKTYADVVKTNKKHLDVQGAIYEVTRTDMKRLDACYRFHSCYRKVKCIVLNQHQQPIECFMYVMQPDVRKTKLPQEEYYNMICQGYADWNLNPYGLHKAWERVAERLKLIDKII